MGGVWSSVGVPSGAAVGEGVVGVVVEVVEVVVVEEGVDVVEGVVEGVLVVVEEELWEWVPPRLCSSSAVISSKHWPHSSTQLTHTGRIPKPAL